MFLYLFKINALLNDHRVIILSCAQFGMMLVICRMMRFFLRKPDKYCSKIGKGAVEAIARQPEAINDIRANMILTAALIEGAALFGIIVGFLAMVL